MWRHPPGREAWSQPPEDPTLSQAEYAVTSPPPARSNSPFEAARCGLSGSTASHRGSASGASAIAPTRQQLTASSLSTCGHSPLRVSSLPRSPASVEQVWKGTLVEELAERPIYVQGRGGLLCQQALERNGRWGSLRASWLVKNVLEAWRFLVVRRHASEERRVEIILDQPSDHELRSVREFEALIAEKNRIISQLEVKLAKMSQQATLDERSIASAVLEAVSRLGLEQLHTEVLTAVRGLDFLQDSDAAGAHRNVLHIVDQRLQDLERASAEQSRALKRLLEVSESPPIANVLQDLQRDVCFDIEKQFRQLAEELRREITIDTQEVCLEVKALHDTQQGAYSELSKQLSTELRTDLQTFREKISDVVPERQRTECKPDWSEVLQAIEQIPSLIELKPDWSELLQAMERAPCFNFEPMLAALREVRSVSELEPTLTSIQASSQDALAAVKAFSANQTTILEAVQQLGESDGPLVKGMMPLFSKNQAYCDNQSTIMEGIQEIRAEHANSAEIVSMLRVMKQEPDLTPVLAGLQGVVASFESKLAADLAPVLEVLGGLERKLLQEMSMTSSRMPAMEQNILQAIRDFELGQLEVTRSVPVSPVAPPASDLQSVLQELRTLEYNMTQEERHGIASVIRTIEDSSARILHQLSCLRSEHGHGLQAVSTMRSETREALQTVSLMSAEIRDVQLRQRSLQGADALSAPAQQARSISPQRVAVQSVVTKVEPQMPVADKVLHRRVELVDASELLVHSLVSPGRRGPSRSPASTALRSRSNGAEPVTTGPSPLWSSSRSLTSPVVGAPSPWSADPPRQLSSSQVGSSSPVGPDVATWHQSSSYAGPSAVQRGVSSDHSPVSGAPARPSFASSAYASSDGPGSRAKAALQRASSIGELSGAPLQPSYNGDLGTAPVLPHSYDCDVSTAPLLRCPPGDLSSASLRTMH